jgi:NAD(P)-dependent dehydrogenase (short-subunit alcohol dehydrogenase family)
MRLKDKVAIVTGAASGIGRATSLLFVREGAKVVVADINDEMGNETASLVEKQGGEAIFVHTDVSKSNDIQNMVESAVEKFGKIDVLVSNAAYMDPGVPVVDLPEEQWDETIDVTLKGHYLGAKYAIPEMIKVGGGSIVSVSSVGGVVAFASNPAYCAAKGGVIQLAKAIAADYVKNNIRANVVCPGAIDTPGAEGVKDIKEAYDYSLFMAEMGRWGTADEMAHAILFLASDEASYITGSVLVADGGWTLR